MTTLRINHLYQRGLYSRGDAGPLAALSIIINRVQNTEDESAMKTGRRETGRLAGKGAGRSLADGALMAIFNQRTGLEQRLRRYSKGFV